MTQQPKIYNVLIVDDLLTVRHLLVKYLSDSYPLHYPQYKLDIDTASNGRDALENIRKKHYDLVITDINMPVMNGFELIENINREFPDLCIALVTSCNIEEYINFIYKYNVTNVIPKTDPFNYGEFSKAVHNLLTKENIFGIEHYLYSHLYASFIIEDNEELNRSIDTLYFYMSKILKKFDELHTKHYILSVSEALINAGVYPSMESVPKRRKDFKLLNRLDRFTPVSFQFGFDHEKFAVAIKDQGGTLDKQDILYWLHKNLSGKATTEIHGRGFIIMREATDSIVVNIQKNVRTEIILMKFFEKNYSGFKPLYINQI